MSWRDYKRYVSGPVVVDDTDYRKRLSTFRPDADSERYIQWRTEVIQLNGFRCEWCMTPGTLQSLHADHIKHWKAYPELRYEVTNGRTLCRKCHEERHGK